MLSILWERGAKEENAGDLPVVERSVLFGREKMVSLNNPSWGRHSFWMKGK